MKLGETIFGVTVWAVLPGRQPGQQTELAHLTWGGPGDAVHLRGDGITYGRMEHYGRDLGPVSGACNSEAAAQRAVDEYFAGLGQGPASRALPDPLQPRAAAEATGAAGVPAAEPAEDETARILADYGTPEKQLQYALWEADRIRRDAFQAAGRQLDADVSTAPARQRFDVAREAAHGRWAATAATAVAWYAREIGATAPAPRSAAADADSAYNQGWGSGSHMLRADIVPRPGGYADDQWREYVAGYAEGARFHATAVIEYAEALREQVQRNLAGSPPGAAAPSRAATTWDAPVRAAADSASPARQAQRSFPRAPLPGSAPGSEPTAARPAEPSPSVKPPTP